MAYAHTPSGFLTFETVCEEGKPQNPEIFEQIILVNK